MHKYCLHFAGISSKCSKHLSSYTGCLKLTPRILEGFALLYLKKKFTMDVDRKKIFILFSWQFYRIGINSEAH